MGLTAWLGLAALAIGLWLFVRSRGHARVFADEHWREVARGMVLVKAAALDRPIRGESDAPSAPDDPRVLTTSAGLAIVYTMSERAGGFVHHCSVSVVGSPTTHAVGGTFLSYAAKLLGLPLADSSCTVGESTVHHLEVYLDEGRHTALVATPVLDVSSLDIALLRREAFDARGRVDWQQVSVGRASE